MVIHGLQKLTLLDYPGHTACTVFTAHCPWRCPFCHNASLVLEPESQPVIPEEEFFSFLSHRKGLLDGVAVTGGEPTLQRDLPEFLRKIKALGFAEVERDRADRGPALGLQRFQSIGAACDHPDLLILALAVKRIDKFASHAGGRAGNDSDFHGVSPFTAPSRSPES